MTHLPPLYRKYSPNSMLATQRDVLISLPRDVISLFLHYLTLEETLGLTEVCSELRDIVRDDKQLWLHILESEVRERELPLPEFLLPVEDANARHVREWTKHALTLEKSYERGFNVSLLRKKETMSVSWVKLLKGRWCLIACSNAVESQLQVWDVETLTTLNKPIARFYLTAPVVDGIIEDVNQSVHIALTLGKSVFSILLLALSRDQGQVELHQITEIPGASHVRLLRGSYIGFAAWNGADDHPHLLNWRSGFNKPLQPPAGYIDSLMPKAYCLSHEPGSAMHIWQGHIFVFLLSRIHIYGCSDGAIGEDDDVLARTELVQTFELDYPFRGFTIIDRNTFAKRIQKSTRSEDDILHVLVQSRQGRLSVCAIRRNHLMQESSRPVFEYEFIFSGESLYRALADDSVACVCLGSRSGYVLWMSVSSRNVHERPMLFITTLRPESQSDGIFCPTKVLALNGPPTELSMDDMPNIHGLTAMDFDDGCGVAVFGTIHGDICFRTFAGIIPSDCLQNDLPVSCLMNLVPVAKVPVDIDIPVFYRLDAASDGDSVSMLVEDANRLWKSDIDLPQLNGWSRDWSRLQSLQEWAVPYSIYGIVDQRYQIEEIISPRLRHILDTIGDPIPVFFDESCYSKIIFHIGEKLYICITMGEDEYDIWGFDSISGLDLIGILPFRYSQLPTLDPAFILATISKRDVQRNITRYQGCTVDMELFRCGKSYPRVKSLLIQRYGESEGAQKFESLSDEEWLDLTTEILNDRSIYNQ